MKTIKLKEEIYRIIDSFLAESKDQRGRERSVEQLNRDRHFAVEELLELFEKERKNKYIRVKIYSKLNGNSELNLVFNEKVPICNKNTHCWDCWDNLIDLFNPAIFSENTRLKIKIKDLGKKETKKKNYD